MVYLIFSAKGTPAAAVTFNFCYEKDLGKNYFKFEYKGFNAFIDEANINLTLFK
jgi:Fe/S biogenesis protein NfuA